MKELEEIKIVTTTEKNYEIKKYLKVYKNGKHSINFKMKIGIEQRNSKYG